MWLILTSASYRLDSRDRPGEGGIALEPLTSSFRTLTIRVDGETLLLIMHPCSLNFLFRHIVMNILNDLRETLGDIAKSRSRANSIRHQTSSPSSSSGAAASSAEMCILRDLTRSPPHFWSQWSSWIASIDIGPSLHRVITMVWLERRDPGMLGASVDRSLVKLRPAGVCRIYPMAWRSTSVLQCPPLRTLASGAYSGQSNRGFRPWRHWTYRMLSLSRTRNQGRKVQLFKKCAFEANT